MKFETHNTQIFRLLEEAVQLNKTGEEVTIIAQFVPQPNKLEIYGV